MEPKHMKYSRIVTTDGYEWLSYITSKELALMMFLVEDCTTELDTSVAIFKQPHKEQFAKHFGITEDSVKSMLKKLIGLCYVVKVGNGIYMVNPHLVNHGHQSHIERNYEYFTANMYQHLSPIMEPPTRYKLFDSLTGDLS